MNITLLISLISAGVAGLAGWGAAWTIQGRTIDKLIIEAKDERIAQQRAARQVTERLTNQVTQAQAQAAVRNDSYRADARAADNAAIGLRDTSTATVRAATDSPATCSAAVSTYDVVFSECATSLREMAITLDRCTNDTKTLIDGWPK